jgi:hypothetical protein
MGPSLHTKVEGTVKTMDKGIIGSKEGEGSYLQARSWRHFFWMPVG